MPEWVHIKDADGIARPVKASDLMLEDIFAKKTRIDEQVVLIGLLEAEIARLEGVSK